jgi:hypothetical protein
MAWHRWVLSGLLGLGVGAAVARADERPSFSIPTASSPAAGPRLPLDKLPAETRLKLSHVLERPSLTATGQPETFVSPPQLYRWLLDHPDLTCKLWQLLGANVSDVKETDGRFRYTDAQGSEVFWSIAMKAPGLHVWYAEGKVKPALLVPMTSFKAVVYLSYTEGKDTLDQPAIRHQVHFVLRCDSRAVALATRMLGKSAPRMTEQYLGQLQTFYGGMAWYLHQDEERARKMYRQIGLPVQVGAKAGRD